MKVSKALKKDEDIMSLKEFQYIDESINLVNALTPTLDMLS